MSIHSTAVVSPRAQLGANVVVGPWCVIEDDASVGDDCILESRVSVKRGVQIGQRNHIFEGCVIGGLPQHTRCPANIGGVRIGDDNNIRENVTIHRALHAGVDTSLGDSNLVMVNVHVAHDCHIGSHCIFANNVMLAGHVEVNDRAYLSGAAAAHQFTRIGCYAMVGGQSHIVKDIPPYVTIDGLTTRVVGLNKIGLKRNGFTDADLVQLKEAYRLIFRSGLKWQDVIARLQADFSVGPAEAFLKFFQGGTRGFTQERRVPKTATVRMPELNDADDEQGLRIKAG